MSEALIAEGGTVRARGIVLVAPPSTAERARLMQEGAVATAHAALGEAMAAAEGAIHSLTEVTGLDALPKPLRDRVDRLTKHMQAELQGIAYLADRARP